VKKIDGGKVSCMLNPTSKATNYRSAGMKYCADKTQ